MEDIGKILQKLDKIEQELVEIKCKLKQDQSPLKLSGIWSGHEITEKEIVEAKASLFYRKFDADKE